MICIDRAGRSSVVVDDPNSLQCGHLKKPKWIPPHQENTSPCIFIVILHVTVSSSLLRLGRKGEY